MIRVVVFILLTILFSVPLFSASSDRHVDLHLFNINELEYITKNKEVVICIDPNWLPYEKFDPEKGYIGIAPDFLREIAMLTGFEFKINKTESWAETLKEAEAGRCDLLPILNETYERSKYLDFTDSYINSPSVFVTKDMDTFINGIEDLSGKTVATVEGYKIDEIIRRDYPEVNVVHVPNIAEALKAVSRGDVFATAGSLVEVSYVMRENDLLDLYITGDAKFDYELKMGVKRGSVVLLDILNKAMGAVNKRSLDLILNKWVSIRYDQGYNYSLFWKWGIAFSLVFLFVLYRYKNTVKTNRKLMLLNNELNIAKKELEEVNRSLEDRIKAETAKRLDNERVLMQQSKLAAMGDMIGMIAHQWRQPLNAVGLYIQELEDDNSFGTLTDEHFEEYVSNIMELLTEMSATIDSFSNFFQPDTDMENFSVCELLSDVFDMFSPLMISQRIKFSFDCGKKELMANGFPNEFRHVILSVMKNAIDSFDGISGKEKAISITAKENAGFIEVHISDNGCGIPASLQSRVFEPYFSTKEEGQGVGLGLYMSSQVMKNMKGGIDFKSSPEGTIFKLRMLKGFLSIKID